MRLFDAVRAPDSKVHIGPQLLPMPEVYKEFAASAVRVTADECSRWYWQSERNYWDLHEHFGPLRLPFDRMWIEWQIPGDAFIEGRWTTMPRSQMAILAVACEGGGPEAPDGTAQSIAMTMIVREEPSRSMGMVLGTLIMFVDDLGGYLDQRIMTIDRPDLAAAASEMFQSCVRPGQLAMSLMNCKNVQVDEVSVPVKKAARDRRKRGWAGLSHHTIKLPGPARPKGQTEARAAAGGAAPIHLVRGHFKTYTDDRPLFGSRTGTYWWSWHARGSEENGKVTKDYEVSP